MTDPAHAPAPDTTPGVPGHDPASDSSGDRPGEVVHTAELRRVLAHLDPHVRSGAFVMTTLPARSHVPVEATVVEDEGITHVVHRDVADREGWDHDLVLAWITLGVETDLALVGLTAAAAGALADEGIACNVLAGRHHDHLLVPIDRLDDALLVLTRLG